MRMPSKIIRSLKMAAIPHENAAYDINTGRFAITSSQGGRTYELQGIITERNIHIAGLFPKTPETSQAGPSSFGTDFLITVLAFSRQMPVMNITTTAARGEKMNGYTAWPKLGFEAKNPSDILDGRKTPKHIAAEMKELADTGEGRLSLVKLNSTPKGQQLWREYGGTIEVYFDTSPGSQGERAPVGGQDSMRVLRDGFLCPG